MSENWPLEKIDNHAEQAVGRLTSQYSHAERLQSLIRVWAGRVQSLEDAAYDMLTQRWIDAADGNQLDGLGEIVGEDRRGREDEVYRDALITRIFLNSASGEPESVIRALNFLWGTGNVAFQEIYPAKIQIALFETQASLRQLQGIRGVTPAGVGLRVLQQQADNAPVIASVLEAGIIGEVRPSVTTLLDSRFFYTNGYGQQISRVTTVFPTFVNTLESSAIIGPSNGQQISSQSTIAP
jgi:hypothetical protein